MGPPVIASNDTINHRRPRARSHATLNCARSTGRLTLLACLVAGAVVLGVYSGNHANQYQDWGASTASLRRLQGGNGPLPKGDRGCNNFVPGLTESEFSPCFEDEDGGEELEDVDPENGGVNGTDFESPPGITTPIGQGKRPPRNVVDLIVFVGLPPFERSVAHSVAKLLTLDMNATIENMHFFLESPEERQGGKRDESTPEEELDEGNEPTELMPAQTIPESPSDETDPLAQVIQNPGPGNPLNEGEVNDRPPRKDRFNMYYLRTDSRMGAKNKRLWWWQYDIKYLCRWEASDGPVLSDEKMADIAANMTNSLDVNSLTLMLRNVTGSDAAMLRVFPNEDAPADDDPFGSDEPPEDSFFEPLDAQEWSWTRYLGFAVFMGTFVGLIVASQIGAIRRRRKMRRQVWGNLASEEGVKELLNTGWVLRDDRMEVFDKARVGYRDNDSMLIGGYEQREPGPGTVIMTPTITTGEETSTRGPSTAPNQSTNDQHTFPASTQSVSDVPPTSASRQQRRMTPGMPGPSVQMFIIQVSFLMLLQVLVPVSAFVAFRGSNHRGDARLGISSESSAAVFDDSRSLSRNSMFGRNQDFSELLGETPKQSMDMFSRQASRGLSRFHQSILSRTRTARQALVTGRDPVYLSFQDSPTLKWLSRSAASASQGTRLSTSQLYVNGTVLEKSTASLERFLWLQEDAETDDGWDDAEPVVTTESSHDYFSLEWVAEVHMERPGYVNVMPRECLLSSLEESQKGHQWSWHARSADNWQEEAADRLPPVAADALVCTGFSLSRRNGLLATLDTRKGQIIRANDRTRSSLLWPNEVTAVPKDIVTSKPHDGHALQEKQDALLVSDGFLVPGKDRGGLYIVRHPGNPNKEWTVGLTAPTSSWFYHKATWIDLTKDGRQSILTARCRVTTKLGGKSDKDTSDVAGQVTSGIVQEGELVWLEAPKPHSYDPKTNTSLEADGTVFDPFASRHLPWKEHVLASGPDVMFCLADLDPSDDTVEVIASQFFDKSVRLYSIKQGANPQVVFKRNIDTQCGAAFASVLADFDQDRIDQVDGEGAHVVIDSGSTVPTLKSGDHFSHLLVTSHECTYAPPEDDSKAIPTTDTALATDRSPIDGGSVFSYRVPKDWKTDPWLRTTVATGFAVRGQLGNVINPGAPGFCYTFPARKGDNTRRPLLAVAGDCAESAYIFRPDQTDDANDPDPSTRYKLMVEIECESTVGSIGVGYGDFLEMGQEETEDYANLYIPCYEKDKVMVFSLGRSMEGLDQL